MTCARSLACLALLFLPGCLDPLVGPECADNLSVCGTGCKVKGSCGIDGGYDLGALDVAAGEASSNGTTPLDSSVSLDQGGAVDIDDGEAHAVIDSATVMDVVADLAADKSVAAERQDGNGNDVRLADASDGRADVSDEGKSDARDSAPILAADARDVREGRDVADAPSTATEVGVRDARDVVDVSSTATEVGNDRPPIRADATAGDLIAQVEAACSGQRIACDGGCVDDQTDPANCGGCGQVCATGICRLGSCKASTAGHIVVIGHDFQTTNADMNQILANAIFLSSSSPVQVAEYVGAADTTAKANSHVAISEAASTVGRQVVLTPVVSSNLASVLAQSDVFLVQSQATAADSTLIQLGNGWSSVLSTFVHSGGIIVLLDGSFPTNSGTVRILVEAGLANVAAVNVVTGDFCSIKMATDPVAALVSTSGYKCLANSISYKGAGIQVIEDLGQSVVLHFTF